LVFIGIDMKKTWIITLIVLEFFSCKKVKNCFSDPGKEIMVEYELQEFDTIVVNNVFYIDLIQDTMNMIKISGYSDFVNTTNFTVDNNCLIIDNCHRCPFVKPEKNKVKVEIHVNKISLIKLNEACEVNTPDTLKNESKIGLIINSKYNEADLKVNCKTFYYWNIHLNAGKIFVSGKAEKIILWNTSLGSVDARNLNTESAYVVTNSKTDCYINSYQGIEVEIQNAGNVYYKGYPTILVNYSENAEGRLIRYSE
jgi:hypothetical protein